MADSAFCPHLFVRIPCVSSRRSKHRGAALRRPWRRPGRSFLQQGLQGRDATHRTHILDTHLTHGRSEEHTSELQSLMRISYAVFCLKKTTPKNNQHEQQTR